MRTKLWTSFNRGLIVDPLRDERAAAYRLGGASHAGETCAVLKTKRQQKEITYEQP
jgi:hypothetical protein